MEDSVVDLEGFMGRGDAVFIQRIVLYRKGISFVRAGKLLNSALFFICLCLVWNSVDGQASEDIAAGRGEVYLQAVTDGTAAFPLYRNSHALLIGVARYADGWPRLDKVPDHLNRLEQLLVASGFQVEISLDPTLNDLDAALSDFAEKYGQDQETRLLVYFNGHGYSSDDSRRGYLVPVDAPAPEPGNDFLETLFPFSRIVQLSRQITARHVLFLFDSCFSDALFKDDNFGAPAPSPVSEAVARPSRQYLNAGASGARPDGGLFTAVLVEALRYGWGDLNQDGYIRGGELGFHLKNRLQKFSQPIPQFGVIPDYGLSAGDFIFVAGREENPEAAGLAIITDPPGAELRIDGRYVGVTPVQQGRIAPDPIVVTAILSGYEPVEKVVALGRGRVSRVNIAFMEIPVTGAITVSSEPSGAEWFLNAEFRGVTPGRAEGLAAGEYFIEVREKGYDQWTGQVAVAKGQVAVIHAVLGDRRQASTGTGEDWTEPFTGIHFVWVKGGCFEMGDLFGDGKADEKPVHEVCVDGFYLGQTEVTQGQWRRIMSGSDQRFTGGGDYPADRINWNDLQAFLNRLKILGEKKFRLPTEAEWEYAARGGGKKEKYAGGENPEFVAWFKKNSRGKPQPVKAKNPNSLGLYDMSGNVYEWCQDWYGEDYYSTSPRVNPQGPDSGIFRVLRGGSSFYPQTRLRTTSRFGSTPSGRHGLMGFRLAADQKP